MEISIQTTRQREVIDITDQVQAVTKPAAVAVNIYAAHTTCAITTADLDPGTDQDLLDAVWQMIPDLSYRHPHDPAHVPAHIASSVIGPGVTIPVQGGRLLLGTWQRVVLVELDGPKERRVLVTSS